MINPRSAIASSANMRVRAGKRRRLVGRAVPAPQRFAPAPLDTWVDDLDEEFGADSDVPASVWGSIMLPRPLSWTSTRLVHTR
jgi:hypothetical protein